MIMMLGEKVIVQATVGSKNQSIVALGNKEGQVMFMIDNNKK